MVKRFPSLLKLLGLVPIALSNNALGEDVDVAVAGASIGVDVQSLTEASRLSGKSIQRLVNIVRNDADAGIVNGALRYTLQKTQEQAHQARRVRARAWHR
jgi:hypothetical protein